MNRLTDQETVLLGRLVRAAPRGGSLTALAGVLGLSPSLLSRRLQPLVERGWVDRRVVPTEAGREVHYRALRGLDVRWFDADLGVDVAWTASAIDWEFPLASRITDDGARSSILTFLRALREHDILDARASASRQGAAVVAIGSAAKGQMDRSSDVDLIVVTSDASSHDEPLRLDATIADLAARTSLATPRAIQARHRSIDDLLEALDVISAAARDGGMVVHDGLRRGSGAKDERVLACVEGKRR